MRERCEECKHENCKVCGFCHNPNCPDTMKPGRACYDQLIKSIDMREIKFRAWSKNGKYFVQPDSVHADMEDASRFQDLERIFKNDGYVFQQFTGLKDKNGKEIYEGDIIRTTYGNLEIVWTDKLPGFTFKGGTNVPWILMQEQEVIGNIYENPDLLK